MSNHEHDTPPKQQEWSYFYPAEEVDEKVTRVEISPSDDEKQALCNRLGLTDIKSLRADLTLQRNQISKVVHIIGHVVADVVQKCVVTMDPVDAHIDDSFEAWYAEPSQAVSFAKAKRERMSPKEQEEQPMLEEYDDPEPIEGGKIDLGELVSQHFSLFLDPYPRKEGLAYDAGDQLEEAPEGTYDNPFAALKEWKEKETKKDK